jgi:hypothetical protein
MVYTDARGEIKFGEEDDDILLNNLVQLQPTFLPNSWMVEASNASVMAATPSVPLGVGLVPASLLVVDIFLVCLMCRVVWVGSSE